MCKEETDIQPINIQPGDVVLIRGHLDQDAALEMARQAKCLVLFLPDGVELETMNEHAMNRAGWYRQPETKIEAY